MCSQAAALFSIPTSTVWGFQFFHAITNTYYYYYFLVLAIPVGVTWHLITILLRISLVTLVVSISLRARWPCIQSSQDLCPFQEDPRWIIATFSQHVRSQVTLALSLWPRIRWGVRQPACAHVLGRSTGRSQLCIPRISDRATQAPLTWRKAPRPVPPGSGPGSTDL